MRQSLGSVAGVLVLAVSLQSQQSQGQQPQSAQAGQPAEPPALEIYQIDLNPTGMVFALSKPKLEGNYYVYTAWPQKKVARVPQASVKKITQRTKDLNKESIYQIDLVPAGRMIARDIPKLQGGAYVFHALRTGTFMSVRVADVKNVTRLTGLPAFKVAQEELGAALNENPPMGDANAHVIQFPEDAPVQATPASQTQAPANSIYQGVPGVTDAYAPADATVASPGAVPKARAPAPTKAPQ